MPLQNLKNNYFVHKETGVKFIVPADKQISQELADKLMEDSIKKQKQEFFDTWKSEKQNKDWKGDEETKKAELFARYRRSGSEILLF
jgi:hypothetical protein